MSENIENIFFVLLSFKYRFKWMNKLQISVFLEFLGSVSTSMEIALY